MIERNTYFSVLVLVLTLPMTAAQAQPFVEGANHPRWEEAVQFANRWLDLADAGRAEETMELMTPIFRANLSLQSWRENLGTQMLEWGQFEDRELHQVVWYEDPEDAPLPGLYAAVEFNSRYENLEKHFQYVILHSQNGEDFRVMRQEAFILGGSGTAGLD